MESTSGSRKRTGTQLQLMSHWTQLNCTLYRRAGTMPDLRLPGFPAICSCHILFSEADHHTELLQPAAYVLYARSIRRNLFIQGIFR